MLAILVIFMTNQMVNRLKYVMSGKISLAILFKVLGFETVVFVNFLLPLGGYIAALFVLARLYTSNELTVMRACGISQVRVLRLLLGFGLGLGCLSVLLSFWISPKMEGLQGQVMSQAAGMIVTRKVLPQRFEYINKNVVYARKNDVATKTLTNVFIAQPPSRYSSSNPLADWDVLVSKRMKLQKEGEAGNPFMVMHQGYRYHFDDKSQLLVSHFGQHGVLLPSLKIKPPPWPQAANVAQLWRASALDYKAKGQLFLRLSVPLTIPILILIAFGLTKIESRKGKMSYILPAIIGYAMYFNSIFMMQRWVVQKTMTWWLGLCLLHGVPLLVAIALITYRHGGWPRTLIWQIK